MHPCTGAAGRCLPGWRGPVEPYRITSSQRRTSAHVADFEGHHAFVGPIGPMLHPWRSAGIHSLLEMLVTIPMTAFNDVNLFPKIVDEHFAARATGIGFREPSDKHLVRVLRQNFLVKTGRRSWNGDPRQ